MSVQCSTMLMDSTMDPYRCSSIKADPLLGLPPGMWTKIYTGWTIIN